ncbi:LPXTG cell wall anchor domain-containing protein [Streptomyces sp. SBST2-5]|uniref:LPXTG cell wall anchor domain-containing protein n=1 Tax=Streptomyces composti TaxID=2720025 RepID=A0ABX1A3Y1_9ACTN|nr:SCO1860 family LAETG-anchored protein [Streptomyces composti]NJP49406.1 LPXTG cell wall anchor domain-containing protein [Streptomyces composti]
MSARRWAAVATATVLAAGSAALASAGSAYATGRPGENGEKGAAGAVVLRTDLDVALADKSVHVPLSLSLNEVSAPQSARRTALTASLDGVDRGRAFTVLSAEAADAAAAVEGGKAESSATLAKARVHVPGLPRLGLIEVEKVSSKAVCEAGSTPLASATLPGAVTVLGKRVRLTSNGPTEVKVPGVGEVRLDLSKTETSSRTAVATALKLSVSVNPLKLNVAEVEGAVTLVEARCEAPAIEKRQGEQQQEAVVPEQDSGAGAEPQGERGKPEEKEAGASLAETGGDAMTPYVAAGAVALLGVGAGAVLLSRRRKS